MQGKWRTQSYKIFKPFHLKEHREEKKKIYENLRSEQWKLFHERKINVRNERKINVRNKNENENNCN